MSTRGGPDVEILVECMGINFRTDYSKIIKPSTHFTVSTLKISVVSIESLCVITTQSDSNGQSLDFTSVH